MKKETRKSAIILAISLLIIFAISVSAGSAKEEQFSSIEETSHNDDFTQADWPIKSKYKLEAAKATQVQSLDKGGTETYIVVLNDPPLASYRGEIEGLAATNPQAQDINKFDAESVAAKAYSGYLERQQEAVLTGVEAAIGRALDVSFRYKATLNGFAAEMSASEAKRVENLDGVWFVEPEKISYPDTDAGPAWINADDVWLGLGSLPATKGEGIIVGVIDTGVDPWNPSFAATGDDGYSHTNPFGSGNFKGVCDPSNTSPPVGVVGYDPTFPCNDKLIGVWGYTAADPNPRDSDGHGSHTSSTAAGNVVVDSNITTPTDSYTATISGVAPHANLIVYDGCTDGGGCPGAALSAARDQALIDGVDVINYSIGSSSPTGDFWADSESLQWLALRDGGVFVATSAGNSGNDRATIGSPGDIPWITTVGANSHDRAFLNSIELDNGVDAPIIIDGFSMTDGYGPAPVVLSSDFGSGDDARLCAPGAFAPGTFSGQIVVCERGIYGRVAKGQSVKDGGAGGFILAQPDPVTGGPGSITTDPHVLPAVHIDYQRYQDLLTYLALTGSTAGTISGSTLDVDANWGDVMATFSSRGPNRSNPDILVPSVTAPGRAIWAAYHQGAGGDGNYTFNVIQGTSMSSPHVTGAGALMKALHPDWSATEIQSALMTTARPSVLNDDGFGPTTFDIGSGHIDLAEAGQAGLVLDITTQEFQNADPSLGGEPRDLNLASLGNAHCVGICSWTRTVTSTLSFSVNWDISTFSDDNLIITTDPISFTLPAGGSQEIEIQVDALSAVEGEWAFGEIVLSPSDEASSIHAPSIIIPPPDARLPVAVLLSTGTLQDLVTINTRRDAGSHLVEEVTTLGITDLTVETFGLSKAFQKKVSLSQDPTWDDPYDNLNDGTTHYFNVTVPASAKRLVAEIFDSEAPDMDLFVGTGPTPSQATEKCASTSGTGVEYCNIDDPTVGFWWILVQNWNASSSPPDQISIAHGLVAADEENMMVSGPNSVPAAEPFDLRIFWDEKDFEAGDRWYGRFTIGTDPGNPGNIGASNVDLYRHEDDVTKEVSSSLALPGDKVTFTITIQPNITKEDLTYDITDTIPAGLTYVPGSASATSGSVGVVADTLTWTGKVPATPKTYAVETSVTDPIGCAAPLSSDDGKPDAYIDLEAFEIMTDPIVSGDEFVGEVDFSGGEFSFFGEHQGESIFFTDDGFAFFTPSTPGGWPAHQPIPTAADPNNLMAIFWRDWEVVYDFASNRGVTLANLTSSGLPVAAVIEFDDVEGAPAGSKPAYDFEIIAYYEPDPGRYEYIFAYDNLSGPVTLGTIGLENISGLKGVPYAFNDITVSNGMAVCFDEVPDMPAPTEITFQVMVDGSVHGSLTNEVLTITDNLGDKETTAKATLTVGMPLYLPIIYKE